MFDSCVDGEDYWWEDPYDNPVEVLKTCAAWNDRTKGRLKMHPDVPDCEQLESDSGFADTCSPDETMVCKETDPETGGDTCRLKTCESVRSCYEDIYYWVDYGADAVPYCDPEFGTFDDTFKGDICPNEYNLKNGECSDYDAWWLRSFNTKYCKTVDAAGDEYLHPVSCTKPKKRFGIFGSRYFQWELGEGQRIEDVSFLDDYSDCWSDTGF